MFYVKYFLKGKLTNAARKVLSWRRHREIVQTRNKGRAC